MKIRFSFIYVFLYHTSQVQIVSLTSNLLSQTKKMYCFWAIYKFSRNTFYRPISLLSCVGKVAERVVKNRLYAFLENSKLIIKEQSGFRNKRGTSDNLLFMTQKIQECLNRGKKVCGIFFDISKAFDKVWHAGLIYKLIYLGVPMYIVRFIKNFLSGRFFKVKVNDKFSRTHPITCSVPQGSVLGPLFLFSFYWRYSLVQQVSVILHFLQLTWAQFSFSINLTALFE